jgi:hypothetical protein
MKTNLLITALVSLVIALGILLWLSIDLNLTIISIACIFILPFVLVKLIKSIQQVYTEMG